MEKKKRHRRTKAEMIAYRAAKAQKNVDKYKEKIEKKMSMKGSSSSMTTYHIPQTEIDDGKCYDIAEVLGTEAEMNKFYEENKAICIAKPYLYFGETYRVTYWKERN